jgi:outer membrane protein insertion porin family
MKSTTIQLHLLACLLLVSCSVNRLLPKGKQLYAGAEIVIESNERVANKQQLKKMIEKTLRPKPNKSFMGMHPKLWRYLVAGEKPKNKLMHWIKSKGEEPVYIEDVKAEFNTKVIDAKLFNNGIFDSQTNYKTIEKINSAKISYTCHIHNPYKIGHLDYKIKNKEVLNNILSDTIHSFIKAGESYQLENLKKETIRINALLKEKGYFYFQPDYLYFKADTSAQNKTIKLELSIKDSIPTTALQIYRMNKVTINQDYSLNNKANDSINQTISYYNEYIFLHSNKDLKIRNNVIARSIHLNKNEVYSIKNHNNTLSSLMSMGNFKFVQVKITDSDTTAKGFLDVQIAMTPISKFAFSTELDLVSKSNNYIGPSLNLSLLNRNTFGGAEFLKVEMAGTFEAQISNWNKNLATYTWYPNIELTFPTIIVPFKLKPIKSIYLPKTQFSLSYKYLKRVEYFNLSTFLFSYGFKWKETVKKEHLFNPMSISYTNIWNQSNTFSNLLLINPYLKRGYEEQFISATTYSYTYQHQMDAEKKLYSYFQLNTEMAGNSFSLIKSMMGDKITSNHPSKVAGTPYSQYAKINLEGRIHYKLNEKSLLAFRMYTGIAKPYGNSATLPYIKQFFSGGPNSIRAFQINSVGPGSYFQNQNNLGILQLGGDLKLEMNAEYRFDITRLFKGAFFYDAGNIWMLPSPIDKLGSPFSITRFHKELAMGIGLGIRIDLSFFILRFDLAAPIRKPWLTVNKRWVAQQIDFGNANWRKENLVFNIAIGYPF